MRIHICAVGRLRSGPEKSLIDDYATRFDRTGRNLGLGPISFHEVEDKKGSSKKGDSMQAEAALLERTLPKGALVAIMDERGKVMSSPDFAAQLGAWRDNGRGDLAILIGGADGLSPQLRARADFSLSFGKMVWPHMLVRVMIAEQLYRAASILSGAPYHRE